MADVTNPQTTPTPPLQHDLLTKVLVILILVVLAIMLVGTGLQGLNTMPHYLRWFVVLGAMVALLIMVGYRITNGVWLGILVDTTNHMSLSRLQITLWTLLTLSAYMVIAVPRIVGGLGDNALQITFPEQLILAMGISAASFAGSSLIQSNKKKKQPNTELLNATIDSAKKALTKAETELADAEKENTAALQALVLEQSKNLALPEDTDPKIKKERADAVKVAKEAQEKTAGKVLQLQEAKKKAQADKDNAEKQKLEANAASEGLLHVNGKPTDAHWEDLFRGNEVSNYSLVDMGKVQMLFFTVVIVFTYGHAILTMLYQLPMIMEPSGVNFPPISQSMDTLLGISHAAYLSNKTIDHTPTEPKVGG